MDSLLTQAIQSCIEGEVSFTKFISANDAGKTGGHQSGFYVPVSFCEYIFETTIIKGNDYERYVKVKWQDDFTTDSRFKYYGSKNECHFTRFQKNFPFLTAENVGNLLIVTKREVDYYEAFVLSSDVQIEEFFDAFGISSTETNGILPEKSELSIEDKLSQLFQKFIERLEIDFPPTQILAKGARDIFFEAYNSSRNLVLKKPDKNLLNWIAIEYDLFKFIENNRYSEIIRTPFSTVDELVRIANTILNRRKSRAGKSLEHHLAEVFEIWKISYSSQVNTEEKKKPDFIFPDIETYYKEKAGSKKLIFLGAKTTCKDRWRQIIGEAEKIPHKHLFTLQQGISSNQLNEMKASNVSLVVPKPYITSFPKEHRKDIWTLDKFVNYVAETQK
ncbi:MAG: type II restriction endonuclease [Bacteroidota bacterium]